MQLGSAVVVDNGMGLRGGESESEEVSDPAGGGCVGSESVSPSDEADSLLDRAYSLATPEDNRELYADWAQTYDQDFIAATDYVYHANVATLFVAAGGGGGGVIADVGCGTGLAGVALADLGQTEIDGLDISPEMLAVAAAKTSSAGKAAYRNLIEADLTSGVDVADNTYTGVVSSGTFTHGHLGPECLGEVVRIAAPGALAAIGINEDHYLDQDFEQWFGQASQAGRLELPTIEKVDIYGDFNGAHSVRGCVALFRVR